MCMLVSDEFITTSLALLVSINITIAVMGLLFDKK
ncbi:hypothetical protein DC852_21350 [Vibrio parahaemolyticus]|uniref:Uncharacterized protein n=1 Tax=Vibrio parahaemolyticus TaxID=670 RepID=A0AA46L8R2_VIBPH|nr:hypothetical protein [Vibrio parahaemolyticus]EGQ8273908.1 hypothetical protein [Vibrio parahaemolyticus]EGQ8807638.1 hypothetical protein [Vibrio parahaemolyticus]EGQ8887421.1 hypothetical protein [Vibrio parahaemolyticus]EGQ8940546.1 hypothetical protein [Vibrio parahaemolyticus]